MTMTKMAAKVEGGKWKLKNDQELSMLVLFAILSATSVCGSGGRGADRACGGGEGRAVGLLLAFLFPLDWNLLHHCVGHQLPVSVRQLLKSPLLQQRLALLACLAYFEVFPT